MAKFELGRTLIDLKSNGDVRRCPVRRTVNEIRVTAGVTACDLRRPVCSTRDVKVTTRTIRQVKPGRRNGTGPQPPGSVRKMSGCQEDVRMSGKRTPEQQTPLDDSNVTKGASRLSSKLTQ
ncbi:hypothetical protein ElyMa_003981300 [Elysia marginata]|uniref:Uncharacterized protein n=1 Tax=Elysia marginata TaxID=1093978 RepID=A0AAV4FZW4_9GAST|nr:hypothetical protein ElyMa_003981300 [Elysia marginata]